MSEEFRSAKECAHTLKRNVFISFLITIRLGIIKMERYCGFINDDGYRIEVLVPTTIFDSQRGVIRAYRGRMCVDQIYFKLRELPKWYVPLQAILLGKDDEKTLEKRTKELMKRLPAQG